MSSQQGTPDRSHLDVALLENFSAASNVIQLADGLTIETLVGDFKDVMQRGISIAAQDSEQQIFWGIVKQYAPNQPPLNPDDFRDRIMRPLLLTLRLLGVGAVHSRFWLTKRGGSTVDRRDMIAPAFEPATYQLDIPGVEALQKVWPFARESQVITRHPLAVRRFEGLYQAKYREDRLVDAWVALENLFLSDGENTELSYRLALRASTFLRGEGRDSAAVFKDLRQAYNIRSSILHGSAVTPDTLNDALDKTVGHLREIFGLLTFRQRKIEIKAIDDAVATGGSLQEADA